MGSDLDWDETATYTGYRGQSLTFTEFMKATKNGCSQCGCEITTNEVDEITWEGPKTFTCKICTYRISLETKYGL